MVCHDLAKHLSYFDFDFDFLLVSFILDLLLQEWSIGRHHVTQSQSHKYDISHTSVTVTTCDKVDT